MNIPLFGIHTSYSTIQKLYFLEILHFKLQLRDQFLPLKKFVLLFKNSYFFYEYIKGGFCDFKKLKPHDEAIIYIVLCSKKEYIFMVN